MGRGRVGPSPRPPMRLRLLFLIAVAGCSSPAPLVVAPPPEITPPPPVVSPEPDPIPVTIEVEPLDPVGADSGQVAQRRIYEGAQVAEWTLVNGLTVVYRWEPGADGYDARLSASGGWRAVSPSAQPFAPRARWGALEAVVSPDSRVARGEAARFDEVLSAVSDLFSQSPDDGPEEVAALFDRPTAFTLVVRGPIGWEWVESAIGGELSRVRGRRARVAPERIDATDSIRATVEVTGSTLHMIDVRSSDLPAVAVLAEALRTRGADLSIEADGVAVAMTPIAQEGVWASLSDAELRQARSGAAQAARSPAGEVRALAYLYALPGRFRPVRPPAEAVDLADAIERVAPDRVRDLLDRLRAARPLTILPPDE